MIVLYAALIFLLQFGESAAQETDVPEPIYGPEESNFDYSYTSSVSHNREYLLRYEFCNQRERRSMSFAWVEAGFGVTNEAALFPLSCAHYVVSERNWAIARNSPLIFSDRPTTISQMYVRCADEECEEIRDSRFEHFSRAELRSAVQNLVGPQERNVLFVAVESYESDMAMQVVWDLPPMEVALVVERQYSDDDLETYVEGEKVSSVDSLINEDAVFSEWNLNDYIGVIVFDSYDADAGEASISIPPDFIGENTVYFLGIGGEDRTAQFVMRVPWNEN